MAFGPAPEPHRCARAQSEELPRPWPCGAC